MLTLQNWIKASKVVKVLKQNIYIKCPMSLTK